jgi:uncharacterized protein (TIGR02266 family)
MAKAYPEPRRQTPRFRGELEISLRSDSQFWVGTTTNLSEGGVFVATRELKPIGTEVELVIRLPDLFVPLWTLGIVRWIRDAPSGADAPLGMGLQWKLLSDEALQAIHRFVGQRPPLRVDD